jgi:hypothetical protein
MDQLHLAFQTVKISIPTGKVKGPVQSWDYLPFGLERVNTASSHSVGEPPLFGWVPKTLLELALVGIDRRLTVGLVFADLGSENCHHDGRYCCERQRWEDSRQCA